jgi:ADP-heptose:LPS heptosyltransferase/predicted SAM-dependent methyltransferase
MVWKHSEIQEDESAKIRWELPQYTRGKVLDIGCGQSKAYPHFVGVDNCADNVLFGAQIEPDVKIETADDLSKWATESQDAVYSSHTLEHMPDPLVTLKEWWRVIKVGGHLCLYLPDETLYPKIGEFGANPDHKHNLNQQKVIDWMSQVGGWELLRDELRSQGSEYSFFQIYKKLRGDTRKIAVDPKPAKSCAIVRYGAIGDLMQTSSILPGLKAQGYHITLYTTAKAHEPILHDPNIDAFYLQDKDQVPNSWLGTFWANEKPKFDRWINLSESVEGTFLTLPDRMSHQWPKSVKDKYLDTNYLEFMHDIAEIPGPAKVKFYSTLGEKVWAKNERKKLGGDYLVMYALAGSSVHKVWPHMDALFAALLLNHKNCRIVTVGDDAGMLLEQGWEKEPRVKRKAGKYTIRQTLSLLEQCDLVIGPETGVMNAASYMPMRKVVFLSHSSNNNLTRDWVNTVALEPENTPCFPCHKLIYGWDQCVQGPETAMALCAENIKPDRVWQAIEFKKAA